ncbi:MAG: hypothetical protein U9N59_06600 [Campylobacterota bacterium]|nr:hypothetical protein [Campylobacterota bacterium]
MIKRTLQFTQNINPNTPTNLVIKLKDSSILDIKNDIYKFKEWKTLFCDDFNFDILDIDIPTKDEFEKDIPIKIKEYQKSELTKNINYQLHSKNRHDIFSYIALYKYFYPSNKKSKSFFLQALPCGVDKLSKNFFDMMIEEKDEADSFELRYYFYIYCVACTDDTQMEKEGFVKSAKEYMKSCSDFEWLIVSYISGLGTKKEIEDRRYRLIQNAKDEIIKDIKLNDTHKFWYGFNKEIDKLISDDIINKSDIKFIYKDSVSFGIGADIGDGFYKLSSKNKVIISNINNSINIRYDIDRNYDKNITKHFISKNIKTTPSPLDDGYYRVTEDEDFVFNSRVTLILGYVLKVDIKLENNIIKLHLYKNRNQKVQDIVNRDNLEDYEEIEPLLGDYWCCEDNEHMIKTMIK